MLNKTRWSHLDSVVPFTWSIWSGQSQKRLVVTRYLKHVDLLFKGCLLCDMISGYYV